jgi:hypothetical protein
MTATIAGDPRHVLAGSQGDEIETLPGRLRRFYPALLIGPSALRTTFGL